jgi:hypothetical protein
MVCVARIFDKSWSDRESRRRRSLVHDVKLDLGDAAPGNSQRFSGGRRDVDNASGDEWAAVIDPNRDGPSGANVGDTHARAEWQCAVGGGQFMRVEFFTARGPRLMAIKACEPIRGPGCLGVLWVGFVLGGGRTFFGRDAGMPAGVE